MKKVLSLILAGTIGGAITLGGSYLLDDKATAVTTPATTTEQVFTKNNYVNVPFDFKGASKKAMPAVVHITATQSVASRRSRSNDPWERFFEDGGSSGFEWFFGNPYDSTPRSGTGSGVIYNSEGYIVTNNHVIESADVVEVTLYDNRTFSAEVVGADPSTDLAVLKINANNLPTMRFGDSDAAEVGEWVLAVGNPFDLTSTVTAGIISAKARDINILRGGRSIESFIQTDAAVNPGNSGGALVNALGELIGINTAIATRTGSFSGYSFAIPVNIVNKIVDDIIRYGEVQRGMIGIDIQNLDTDYAKELGVNFSQGVVVVDVLDGSAGQYAGLVPNDIITKVDGVTVKTGPELQELAGRKKPNDIITLTIYRDGKYKDIPVRLKKAN